MARGDDGRSASDEEQPSDDERGCSELSPTQLQGVNNLYLCVGEGVTVYRYYPLGEKRMLLGALVRTRAQRDFHTRSRARPDLGPASARRGPPFRYRRLLVVACRRSS